MGGPASGITCDNGAVAAMNKIKGTRPKDGSNGWLILEFTSDLKQITVKASALEEGDDKSFNAMKKVLVDNSPPKTAKGIVAYLAIDLTYTTTSGQTRTKQAYAQFSIDGEAPMKHNMCLATSIDSVKKVLGDVGKMIPIKEWDELNEDNIINTISNDKTK